MNAEALEHARAGFRAAARALDPDAVATPTPDIVRAWLTIQTARPQPRWLAAAVDAAQRTDLPFADDACAWVEVFCRGWVQQAIGPFRRAAEQLLSSLPDHPRAAAALLGWWRITGDRPTLERALSLLESTEADPEALRLGWHATADAAFYHRATALLGEDPSLLPLHLWPVAADLLDLGPDAFARPLATWASSPPPPEGVAVAAAALALPPLRLVAAWWIPDELREGPMAEAATFPWPALRIRFERLPHRDQIHFRAALGDAAEEELEDVGVVAPWLESLVAAADRGPLLSDAVRPTRRRGGLRR